MRTALEVVPKLGVKSGMPALRIDGVATYDRPIEHLAGQLDVLAIPLEELAVELVRVAHPDGAIWFVVWKKGLLPDGASGWDESQQAMLETGWVDNKILSLGQEVYATRYVRRRRPPLREPDPRSHRS